MGYDTITTTTVEELLPRVARRIMDRILAHMNEKGSCVLGVVGGRVIPGLADALAKELHFTRALHTGSLVIVWLDERIDHDKNFFHDLPFLEELCTAGIAVTFHPIVGLSTEHALDEARSCEERLRQLRGDVRVDVAILSAGEDGHVASLFPGSTLLHSTTAGYAIVNNSPKPPKTRITVTPPVLHSATDVFLFFVGDKRAAYTAFIDPRTPVARCPAVLLRDHSHLTVGVALSSSEKRRKV